MVQERTIHTIRKGTGWNLGYEVLAGSETWPLSVTVDEDTAKTIRTGDKIRVSIETSK